jgi:hypothetical protein
MGQDNPRARKGIVSGLGILAGIPTWLLVAYVGAEVTLIFSWTGVGDDFVNNQSSLIYPEEELQNWDVIRREVWLRSLVPPPLRAPCFTGNEIGCQWADRLGFGGKDSVGWTSGSAMWLDYWLVLLIGFGFSAIVSGALVWYATRKKRVSTLGPEAQ